MTGGAVRSGAAKAENPEAAAGGVAPAVAVEPGSAGSRIDGHHGDPETSAEGRKLRIGDERGYHMRRLLACTDAVAIVCATAATVLLDGTFNISTSPPHAWLIAPVAIVAWLAIAGLDGMFFVDDRRIDPSTSEEMFRIARDVGLWLWVVFALHALSVPGAPVVTNALALGGVTIPLMLVLRDVARTVARGRSWYGQRVVIVGSHVDCERVRRTVARHPEYGLAIVGELQPQLAPPHEATISEDEVEGMTNVDALIAIVVGEEADRVIFASSYSALEERTGALRFLAERGVMVDLVPGDSDVFRVDAELHHIEGLPLLTLPSTNRPRSAGAVKRTVDVAMAGAALVILAPVFALAAIAIKVDSRGPVFFRQTRVGIDRLPFGLLKFRTMDADAEARKSGMTELNSRGDGMFKIPEDPRITRMGRLLRKYSLDELPQLINVVLGHMSLVGPRPLIDEEAGMIDGRYAARFKVRPGITGPWQVLGRSDIPFDDMMKLDYTYVTNWSVGYDVKLMARTLTAMIAGRGAY